MFRLISAGLLMTLLLPGCAPRSLGPAQEGTQNPPLHQAVLMGRADKVAQQLAKPDVDINKRGPHSSTPLHLAAAIRHAPNQQQNGASYPNTRIVQLLLNRGADPERRHGQTQTTPIHGAANAAVVDVLVAAGADPMARDIHDNTPLHYAMSPEVARALLRHGADRNASNIGGHTPVKTMRIRREQFSRSINNQSGSLSAEQKQLMRRHKSLMDSTIAVLARSTDSDASARSSQAATALSVEEQVDHLLIRDSSGRYLSPYTSDGVVAEWVDKAINAKIGSSAGSTAGAAAGSALASKALENVPGGSFIGGMLGSKAGQAMGREAAIDEEYMRNTSDLSFNSLDQMAQWLIRVHGQKANFAEVINATSEIYTGLKPALSRAQRQR